MNKIVQDLKIYYKNGDLAQKIIFWNVAISIVFFLLQAFYPPAKDLILNWFSLSAAGYTSLLKPWSYFTYAFLHADIFHLLSNIIMLHFAAKLFYTYFKNMQFLTVFFGGVVFAGIIYILASVLFNMQNVLVGASAGVLAVLFAVVSYNPHYEVRLILIGKVKLWMIGLFLILFFIIQIPTSNLGGHIAHFAGLFFGWFYTKLLFKGTDLALIPEKTAAYFNFKRKKTPFKKVYHNKNKAPQKNKNLSDLNDLDKQKRIDDILDKISQSGYDSLTQVEKDFLFRAGKN
nr:rhomboid family intramembrane serine protease [uncultured Flavobacterium sp.]